LAQPVAEVFRIRNIEFNLAFEHRSCAFGLAGSILRRDSIDEIAIGDFSAGVKPVLRAAVSRRLPLTPLVGVFLPGKKT
jgi:hypothetical protein